MPTLHPAPFKRLQLVLAVSLLVCLIGMGLSAMFQVPRPYEVDYEEGNVLNACLRLLEGQNPYPPPDQLPSALNPYGPVAYGILAAPLSASSPSFTPGRIVVFGFSILSAVLIALTIGRAKGNWRVALLFGPLYLSFPVVQDWMFLLRVDFIGVAFSLTGLYLFAIAVGDGYSSSAKPAQARIGRSPTYDIAWLWPVPFFTLAFFTKVTFIAAPVSCVVYLLWTRRLRRAALFLTTLSLLNIAVFLGVQRWSDSWFFFHNFRTHPDPYTLAHLGHMSRGLLAQIVPLLLGVVYSVRQFRRRRASLFAIYFVVAFMASLTAGKEGSSTNHYLELLAAACVCAGLLFADVLRAIGSDGEQKISARSQRWLGAALLTLAVCGVAVLPRRVMPQLEPRRAEFAGCEELYRYVRLHTGRRVLSENTGAVLLAGKPVVVSNPFVYGQLATNGGGSDKPLRELVDARYFDVIILADSTDNFRRVPSLVWSPQLLASIDRQYVPVRQFTCAYGGVAYEPKR